MLPNSGDVQEYCQACWEELNILIRPINRTSFTSFVRTALMIKILELKDIFHWNCKTWHPWSHCVVSSIYKVSGGDDLRAIRWTEEAAAEAEDRDDGWWKGAPAITIKRSVELLSKVPTSYSWLLDSVSNYDYNCSAVKVSWMGQDVIGWELICIRINWRRIIVCFTANRFLISWECHQAKRWHPGAALLEQISAHLV